MKNQNKLMLFLIITFGIIATIFTISRNRDLRLNGITVRARITDYLFTAKSTVMDFKYEFTYKNKLYEGISTAGVNNHTEFIGRCFPARFSPISGRSEIIITPKQFKHYGMKFPDSLSWVKNYLNTN